MSKLKYLLALALIVVVFSSRSVNPVQASAISQVWVPAGCFAMGAVPNKVIFPDELPQHQVCLTNGYWLDSYEVTNAAYQQFIDAGGYSTQKYWTAAAWKWLQAQHITAPLEVKGFTAPQQPRVGVSYYEAKAYAAWRGGRLPTEAEWEYAAAGPNSSNFPWGKTFASGLANLDETHHSLGQNLQTTLPVGSFDNGKSWIGAYDMAGNAWEWVSDRYDATYYDHSVKDDPTGPATGIDRVLRGGSWGYDDDCARTYYRFHAVAVMRSALVGFRIITTNKTISTDATI